MNEEVIDALLRVIAELERLQIPYAVGGSIAGMLYGEVRTTLDADVVVDLSPARARDLVAALHGEFYVDETAVQRAMEHRSSFNAIHLRTMTKVDFFLPKDRRFDREQMRRRRREALVHGSARSVYVAAPEDVLLNKLEWYRKGGEVSDRQWRDVIGIVKAMGQQLDGAHLRTMADEMQVGDLLDRAFAEAGLAKP